MSAAEWFDAFFTQVHGMPPFPWQARLARQILTGEWPTCIALPTAAGKTALIDIAVFALAAGAPGAARRVFLIVDRCLVVDEAVDRSQKLADALSSAASESPAGRVARSLWDLAGPDANENPLYVGTLREGIPKDDSWTRSPLQPTVCCSTVDQVGSSLLFRAYGSRSNLNWPIWAALAANDALIIVDEAHMAQPFLQTLEWIRRYRSWTTEEQGEIQTPFRVIEMSATPRSPTMPFCENQNDRDGLLGRRWKATKPTRLVVAPLSSEDAAQGSFDGLAREMAKCARDMRAAGARVIGVVANRVATARQIHNLLIGDDGCAAELLTGRARPFDRERVWNRLAPHALMGRAEDSERSLYVVATQCIEVGANLDFDALVTEVASIDALEQRFGRLNRDGQPIKVAAAVIAQKDQTERDYEDAVYGEALNATWRWLNEQAKAESKGKRRQKVIDLGVDSLRTMLSNAKDADSLKMKRADAPVLLPGHIDRWSETAPQPAVEAEPALFLHGPKSGPADVLVVWRADLTAANTPTWKDITTRLPPQSEEMLPIPVWAVRHWLARDSGVAPVADVEGVASDAKVTGILRPVLEWQGDDTGEPQSSVRPGSIIVVPAAYGGCDQWGWNPAYVGAVEDVADQSALDRGVPSLRLEAGVVEQWSEVPKDGIRNLRGAETDAEIDSALDSLVAAMSEGSWYRESAQQLRTLKPKYRRCFRGKVNDDGAEELTALCGVGRLAQESRTSSYTSQEIPLKDHLAACASRAKAYVTILGLPHRVAATVEAAARWHDIGKADPRFQAWLRGGVSLPGAEDLAKSGSNGRDRNARERARRTAGYPAKGRHELQTVAMLANAEFGPEIDCDLLLHLAASHHGWCRPFAPVVIDDAPVSVRYGEWWSTSAHGLADCGSGVTERFWRLTRRYGWWGLAYLEMLVRLTDHRISEEELREEAIHAFTCN